MTTIAYKDGIIAYDGFATSGGEITEDDFEKMFIVENTVFFMSGSISDFDNFFSVFLYSEKPNKYNDCAAFVIHEGKLWMSAISAGCGFWKRELSLNKHYALGSGEHYALTALDLGKSAYEAVESASKRDCFTGGLIREYKVKMDKTKRVVLSI